MRAKPIAARRARAMREYNRVRLGPLDGGSSCLGTWVLEPGLAGCCSLLIFERLDGVQLRGARGGYGAEDDAHYQGRGESNDYGPGRDGDGEVCEYAGGDGQGEADDRTR